MVGAIRAARCAGKTAANAHAGSRAEQRRGDTPHVRRRDLVQQRRHESAGEGSADSSNDETDQRHSANLPQNQGHNLRRLRAEGETNADFSCPLKHGVAEEPVDSDNHQDARHQGEERGQQRQCAVSHEVVVHDAWTAA